ncbi:TnsA endonuclease N-terminal domain-containing protein [Variovorax sp. PCZ-1]|uniref:TnsA endonuclease N-terminal domain-containing protein n=1 Tax=Variovorax sp. PCZ-1 TaxID=2835533 RepID=UPI001BCCAA9F|nr:TnsA endonuclease N-terminal domain-containing protein [Variovorax sp. PCZ-1]MBS7806136.1 TnsA endonuclease N-terminal domain-containing protein [Variovorax sp. PCZ-1]
MLGPVRKVRENPYSVTARLASDKLGRMVHAESLLEYDFFSILDFDPRVEKYGEQCLVVPWTDVNQRGRKYHPDVLVKFSSKVQDHLVVSGAKACHGCISTVYEVKPSAVLRESWGELKPKFKAARRALQGTGVRFRLITEKQIKPVFASNVRFLLNYKRPDDETGKYFKEVAIDDELGGLVRTLDEPITPQEIMSRFSPSFELQSRVIARVWRMLAMGIFDADLIEPLTMNTPIWPGQMWRTGQMPTPKWRQAQYDWYR